MLKNRKTFDVLFINGINTAFGGSVAESNKVWQSSFKSNGIDCHVLDTVPCLKSRKKNYLYYIFLSIYFFPGTAFRLIKAPVFEFAYKIAPIILIRFLIANFKNRPKRIVFSHHSVFFLSVFCARFKRVFLIHDLMYIRGRSRGASRRAQRTYLFFELWLYRLAPNILIQSYHEWRVLRHFLNKEIFLVSCCNLELGGIPSELTRNIAVVSDWRRKENVHGAVEFFSSGGLSNNYKNILNFRFFGFNSESIIKKLSIVGVPSGLYISSGDKYDNLMDISEGFFLVPIYHGAGIKRKTLEALCSGRMVVGTKGAFIGLPYWLISNVVLKVSSLHDLNNLPDIPAKAQFSIALQNLSKRFNSLGNIKGLWH